MISNTQGWMLVGFLLVAMLLDKLFRIRKERKNKKIVTLLEEIRVDAVELSHEKHDAQQKLLIEGFIIDSLVKIKRTTQAEVDDLRGTAQVEMERTLEKLREKNEHQENQSHSL